MNKLIVREATLTDWDILLSFFKSIYRENHPLHNKLFWLWQYGDADNGRSFICLNSNNEVVGHVGANFGGGLAWIINVYLNKECRGQGILGRLYQLARAYYPLAATAANQAGLGLYRNMGWVRYYDLVRYVKVNPRIAIKNTANVCREINPQVNQLNTSKNHYFMQPGIQALKFDDNSTGINQAEVGGLRVVDIRSRAILEEQAWDLGYLWLDYITSWNDKKNKDLEVNGWVLDYNSVVPWRLNPLVADYYCDITFLSEKPLKPEFIVHRSYSDHGRVGSLASQ